MKRIEVEQGSDAWLNWRKTVITATDASILMGSNPWETPYKLWQRKLGLIEEKQSNEAMERGKRLEPEARSRFITEYGYEMTPSVVESTDYDFLGASLDGMTLSGDALLEIKCGSKSHEMAGTGVIPQYYRDQIQHQLLVTRALKCFYYSYDGKDGICIEVLPDPDFKDNFLPKARAFWKCVALQEPPALQDGDYKDMSGDMEWDFLAVQYRQADELIKTQEDLKASLRKSILELCGDQNCKGNGIKVMKNVMKGRVAYDDIPELKEVDLDKYRKASTTTWKILVS